MKIFLILLVSCYSLACYSQEGEDSKQWYIPDHYKTQFAGNIGFISAGAGYLYAKDKIETDLLLGYLPEPIGGDDIFTLTTKTSFYPWSIKKGTSTLFRPFCIGGYLSYSFGSQFDTLLPNEYPDGYYWWATSLRYGMYFGGSIGKSIEGKKLSRITLYYEFSTYDLKFISYVHNTDALNITDIFSLALGIKYEF